MFTYFKIAESEVLLAQLLTLTIMTGMNGFNINGIEAVLGVAVLAVEADKALLGDDIQQVLFIHCGQCGGTALF